MSGGLPDKPMYAGLCCLAKTPKRDRGVKDMYQRRSHLAENAI